MFLNLLPIGITYVAFNVNISNSYNVDLLIRIISIISFLLTYILIRFKKILFVAGGIALPIGARLIVDYLTRNSVYEEGRVFGLADGFTNYNFNNGVPFIDENKTDGLIVPDLRRDLGILLSDLLNPSESQITRFVSTFRDGRKFIGEEDVTFDIFRIFDNDKVIDLTIDEIHESLYNSWIEWKCAKTNCNPLCNPLSLTEFISNENIGYMFQEGFFATLIHKSDDNIFIFDVNKQKNINRDISDFLKKKFGNYFTRTKFNANFPPYVIWDKNVTATFQFNNNELILVNIQNNSTNNYSEKELKLLIITMAFSFLAINHTLWHLLISSNCTLGTVLSESKVEDFYLYLSENVYLAQAELFLEIINSATSNNWSGIALGGDVKNAILDNMDAKNLNEILKKYIQIKPEDLVESFNFDTKSGTIMKSHINIFLDFRNKLDEYISENENLLLQNKIKDEYNLITNIKVSDHIVSSLIIGNLFHNYTISIGISMFISGIQQKLGNIETNVIIGTLNILQDDNPFGNSIFIDLIKDPILKKEAEIFMNEINKLRSTISNDILNEIQSNEKKKYKRIFLNFGEQNFVPDSCNKESFLASPTTFI